MAGVINNCGVLQNASLVSLLVVGPAELCQNISGGLLQSAKQKGWRISVHQCESTSEVIQANLNLAIDFIIFALDWRTTQSLLEVETNINQINKHYIISEAVCLVNCYGMSNIMGLNHKSRKIQSKYNIRSLYANVLKAEACVQLGNRILNLIEATHGITSGIPTILSVIKKCPDNRNKST